MASDGCFMSEETARGQSWIYTRTIPTMRAERHFWKKLVLGRFWGLCRDSWVCGVVWDSGGCYWCISAAITRIKKKMTRVELKDDDDDDDDDEEEEELYERLEIHSRAQTREERERHKKIPSPRSGAAGTWVVPPLLLLLFAPTRQSRRLS